MGPGPLVNQLSRDGACPIRETILPNLAKPYTPYGGRNDR